MESNIAQQIQLGSSNYRIEIEGYLNNAESTFGKMNVNLGSMLNHVANKFQENDGRSGKFEGMLISLIEGNKRMQQLLENERREKEKENNEISNRTPLICATIAKQQNLLAASQQAFMGGIGERGDEESRVWRPQ